ncbi:hypothetical protein VTH06DRAFT_7521 [Thermothelomyces fergusii]
MKPEEWQRNLETLIRERPALLDDEEEPTS